jgi:excisionase family DNA binding protein
MQADHHIHENPKSLDIISIIASKVAEEVDKKLKDKTMRAEMLSVKTIAQLLDCSQSEVRKALQQGRMKTVRFGNRGYRVSREEFEKRLARWKNGGELWD